MTDARHVIARWALLAAVAYSLVGCMRPMETETKGKAMNKNGESLFLEEMFNDRREVLTDSEETVVLQILSEAKPRSKRPWGAMSPSPHPRLKYRLNVLMSGRKQYFYFKDDGSLMDADLSDGKARDLARIIDDVAGRMQSHAGAD